LHINFNSVNLSLSGGNRFIFDLSNRLVDRGHNVTITHAGLKRYHDWFSPIKARIIDVELPLLARALGKYYLKKRGFYYDIERALLEHIPDCDINVATYCWTAYPTAFCGKGIGYYLVQNYEPLFFDDPVLQKKASLTYALPLRKLCVSRWLAEEVEGEYIGNGIDLKRFRRIVGLHTDSERLKIMAFRRQGIEWKNSQLLDEVLLRLRRKFGAKIEFLLPENVSEDRLIEMYNEADLLLYLSKFEGFGYPPLEAMACGAAVLTTSCLEYAKHMENAFVLPLDCCADDVVEAVSRVVKNKDLFEKLVENGLETAQQFDFENVVDRFEDCIGCSRLWLEAQ